jgi:hypothetical protein
LERLGNVDLHQMHRPHPVKRVRWHDVIDDP